MQTDIAPARSCRGTILIVDDDAAIRSTLSETLGEAGFATVTAGDGDQALALVQERGPGLDLMVLDLEMPVRSGYEVLQALHRSVAPFNVPVVVLSGHLGILPRGAVAWLKKPVSIVVLFGAVERHLRAKAVSA